jgi:hypothetical protein
MQKFVGTYKKPLLIIGLILCIGTVTAIALMSGGDFSLLGKIVGISSRSESGEYILEQSVGESVGVVKMSGGDYELSSNVIEGAASKLENDLKKAHCYPNPYKPNSGLGHSKITFARLTNHTKVRVYNISGELVYDTERDTPTGELDWDVRNKNGENIASGVYIYLLADELGNKAKGKFAVVR